MTVWVQNFTLEWENNQDIIINVTEPRFIPQIEILWIWDLHSNV